MGLFFQDDLFFSLSFEQLWQHSSVLCIALNREGEQFSGGVNWGSGYCSFGTVKKK